MPLVTYITILLAILNYIRLNDLKKKESPDLALIDAGALQTPYYGGLKQSYRFLTKVDPVSRTVKKRVIY